VPLSRAAEDGSVTACTERRRVVRALAPSRSARRSWPRRLPAAQHALTPLGQKRHGNTCPHTAATGRAAVDKLALRDKVTALLLVSDDVTQRPPRVRAYGARPARAAILETVRVRVQVDQAALAAAQLLLGWRVYATNAPTASLSLAQAVVA